MECVEAALKSSFQKDTELKFSPQTFLEELSGFNAQNVDDFFVDELLNFSYEEEEEEALQQEQQQEEQKFHVSPQNDNHIEISETRNEHFGSLPTSELSVPVEEAAHLEWLSHFVEDSFSEYSTCFPTVTSTAEIKEKSLEPFTVPVQPCFQTPVPGKARSKRTRTGVRVWPLGFGSPSFTTDSTSSSSTSATSSSSPSSPTSTLLMCAGVTQNLLKRKAGNDGGAARRCSHCGVQKTPQWRTGPLGAKTLCNACGVRFKSGRLLPEYRPACSPTFTSELHSNHHRKVLEMRRKKEVLAGGADETGSVPVVPGF